MINIIGGSRARVTCAPRDEAEKMDRNDRKRAGRRRKPVAAETRRERLAEALRANLKRRKAQARAREIGEDGDTDDPDAA